jgi:hypothetical protein
MPRLIWNDHRDAPATARRFGTYIGMTISALVSRLCLALDGWIDPRVGEVEIREPVFIIGNARSGTTLLHRLMAGDSDRFVTFKAWELFSPALCQKRLLSWTMDTLQRRAPRLVARLEQWESRQLLDLKRLNPVGINETQEDELLLIPFFATPSLAVAFPYMQELRDLEYFDDLPRHERSAVLSLYRDCVKRQLAFHGGGHTFLSKNPSFVGKLRSLLEEFPDARIIYPRRDPLQTIPSLLAMLREAWKLTGFDELEMKRASEAIVDGCVKDYFYATQVLRQLPSERFVIVEFEEFTSDPAHGVRQIYEHFGWSASEEYAQWLQRESPKPDLSIPSRRRRLEDFGIDQASVEAQIAKASSQLRETTPSS